MDEFMVAASILYNVYDHNTTWEKHHDTLKVSLVKSFI